MQTLWVIESTGEKRFPYRLSIKKDDLILLSLRVQDIWPGTKGQIFCMREEGRQWSTPVEEIERVPVLSLKRYGKRLAVILDRAKNKRCDFLFLKKKYKTKEGEYEQIFWRTQKALQERRPKVKLTAKGKDSLHVIIDKSERYPWRFHGCLIEKGQLPVGDYALKGDNSLLAIVERKTFENLTAYFGKLGAFHQILGELETYKHSALVIEASYSDFLNPKKMKFYSPTFAARAIAEIHAFHPKLNIVYTGNRKLANEWTLRFFSAIAFHSEDIPHAKVSEALTEYGVEPYSTGGSYYEVRKIIDEMPEKFTFRMLKDFCQNIPEFTIRKALSDLKKEGKISCENRGKKSYWKKNNETVA
ncbi:MAG: ERCC4 domain-containing protein [Acidobacteriota bacterium]